MDGLLNSKPNGHHDFRVERKGDKDCVACGASQDAHQRYERVKVIGLNGTYLAWRAK